ncbi:hypothetical protein DXG03_001640 [Asterophora parasitica]|uniref:F-box domain-containing protein n=1 Tax=Asterophora parasitica TaxID=117018 RepID=A0A9P7G3R2_9AGAR|nr:hypothetical protein DXG03_001640 [Asterophora parasitica]
MDLPREIWAQIFDLAADEDVIFQYGLPTMHSQSLWHKNLRGKWEVRRPTDAMNAIQFNSYATKKAIISTCKSWHEIGAELLFRCLFFHEPRNLLSLCETLESSSSTASTISSSLGWWTKRIHVCRYNRSTTMKNLDQALISIVKHCPNLGIFIVDVPMGDTFGPVADTLATYALKSLRTVHWNVSCELLPKVIWALDYLPSVMCAHIDFESKHEDEDSESVPLGSAGGLQICLPYLQQLTLSGFFGQFLEEATEWSLPSLRCVSFDCRNHRTDQPDALGFLAPHGSKLTFLDLNCIPPLDVPSILALCPELTTFSFNADWRLQPPGAEVPIPGSLAVAYAIDHLMSVIVNEPHLNITTIGLHGLLYAFDVGYAARVAKEDQLPSHIIRRSNDLNVAALNLVNFPKLKTVRTLSRAMLADLNEANGPSEDEGMQRYDAWWAMLMEAGIRLEDCTGALLGTLPDDEEDDLEEDGDDDSDEDEESDEEEEEGEELDIPPLPQVGGPALAELRQLLAECRAMEATREPLMFTSMFADMPGMPPLPPLTD